MLRRLDGQTLYAAQGFNGHPPLGVNATDLENQREQLREYAFQWAPTLGGECYQKPAPASATADGGFQWAPTLGGECY